MPRIAEGLHRLGSDLINFYLVEDATGVTVVDAGVPAFYDDARATASRSSAAAGTTSRRSCSPTRTSTTSASPSACAREHGVPVHVHAADEALAHTQKAPRDGSVAALPPLPGGLAADRRDGAGGPAGASEDRRGHDVRATATGSTSPAARA